MSSLQPGLSATQIVPQQNFRNSAQSGAVQYTQNTIQRSNSDVLRSEPKKLQVVGGQPQQSVLGVQQQQGSGVNYQVWLFGGLALLSVVLLLYALQKAKQHAGKEIVDGNE